jgi:hypothetical protein
VQRLNVALNRSFNLATEWLNERHRQDAALCAVYHRLSEQQPDLQCVDFYLFCETSRYEPLSRRGVRWSEFWRECDTLQEVMLYYRSNVRWGAENMALLDGMEDKLRGANESE